MVSYIIDHGGAHAENLAILVGDPWNLLGNSSGGKWLAVDSLAGLTAFFFVRKK